MSPSEVPCSPAAGPGSGGGVLHNVWETLRLAVPVMIARSGTLVMITVDVIMTGRHRAEELGYYGLGFMAHQVLFVLGLGALMGLPVLVAQADGMGEPRRAGTVWRVGLLTAAVLGVLFAALSLLGERFFLLTGQGAELAREGGAVMRLFALGLPALLLYLATAQFLEGIRRPQANMWLMVLANAVNLALNWLLIYEHPFGGIGAMGAAGAALATSITRWLMCGALAVYALRMRGAARYGVRGPLYFPLDMARKLGRLGAPLAVAQGLESAAFLTVILFAGWLGAQQLAVYQIVNNLFHIVFMLAIGLATATSVRVGNAVGRGDRAGLAWAGWTGAAMGGVLLGVLCLGFRLAPGPLARVYTDDPGVLALAVQVIAIAGLFIVVDGAQAVLAGALRGVGDIVVPSTLIVGGFWGVNVPLGYWLAVTQGWGVFGLIWGLIAGAATAMGLLLVRFHLITRREARPV